MDNTFYTTLPLFVNVYCFVLFYFVLWLMDKNVVSDIILFCFGSVFAGALGVLNHFTLPPVQADHWPDMQLVILWYHLDVIRCYYRIDI